MEPIYSKQRPGETGLLQSKRLYLQLLRLITVVQRQEAIGKRHCISRNVLHGLVQMFCSQIEIIEIPSNTLEKITSIHIHVLSQSHYGTLESFIIINLCNRNQVQKYNRQEHICVTKEEIIYEQKQKKETANKQTVIIKGDHSNRE